MTIKGLSNLIKSKEVPIAGRRSSSVTKVKENKADPLFLTQLTGKKICIEIQGQIHKQLWAAIQKIIQGYPFIYIDDIGWSIPSESEVLDMFKVYFTAFIKKIIKTGIIPIFILEGKCPPMKDNTKQKRIEDKAESVKEMESCRKNKDLRLFKKKLEYTYSPNLQHTKIVRDILVSLNVTVLQAEYEAEGVCAQLVTESSDPYNCSCALIDDHDIFMYGCTYVIRNMKSVSSKPDYEIEGYALNDILTSFNLYSSMPGPENMNNHTEDEIALKRLQLLCILSKNDYKTSGVYNMGPAKIAKLLLKHKIYTYEQICVIDPRFNAVQYQAIYDTLKMNMGYTIFNDPNKKI